MYLLEFHQALSKRYLIQSCDIFSGLIYHCFHSHATWVGLSSFHSLLGFALAL